MSHTHNHTLLESPYVSHHPGGLHCQSQGVDTRPSGCVPRRWPCLHAELGPNATSNINQHGHCCQSRVARSQHLSAARKHQRCTTVFACRSCGCCRTIPHALSSATVMDTTASTSQNSRLRGRTVFCSRPLAVTPCVTPEGTNGQLNRTARPHTTAHAASALKVSPRRV